MHLTEAEIEIIIKYLDQQVKISSTNKEEILDHLCSQIELELMEGSTFEISIKNIKATSKIAEIKLLDKQLRSIKTSQKKYLNISLIIVIFLSLLSLLFYFKNEKVTPSEIASNFYQESDLPSLWPLKNNFKISSEFGMRIHPFKKKSAFHQGIDIPAKLGEHVQSTAGGKVTKVGFDKQGHGAFIVIQHNSSFRSIYSQLSEVEISIGDVVTKGQLIGLVGSSGLSTAPHLHFEIINDGKKVDPLIYIKV